MTQWVKLSLSEAEKLPQSDCQSLFPMRWKKALRYVRYEDRLRSIGAGALLHGWLGVDENKLRYGEYGKPYLPQGRWFSLSHSGEYVLLAVDERPVGTDVERLNKEQLMLSSRVFTPEERLWMKDAPLERFFTLWTLKESVMKQTGRGLNLDPASFDVMPLVLDGRKHFQGEWLYGRHFCENGHAFALCGRSSMEGVRPQEVKAEDCLRG